MRERGEDREKVKRKTNSWSDGIQGDVVRLIWSVLGKWERVSGGERSLVGVTGRLS